MTARGLAAADGAGEPAGLAEARVDLRADCGRCAVFDCFGAGQQVVQVTFGGRDWRQAPEIAASMFAVFPVMRQLRELLWYLAEALTLLPAGMLRDEVDRAQEETRRLVDARADELVRFDAAAHRRQVGPLLERVSGTLRAEVGDRGRDGWAPT